MIFFIEAFFLGLLFNAAPGIVFAETIKRGINGGFIPAFLVQIGSIVGDALWAILGLIGIGILLNLDIIKIPISILSSCYLMYLAYDSYTSSFNNYESKKIISKSHKNALKSGIFLSITNPQNIAYWAALGGAFSALGIKDPEYYHYFIFFSGFISSSFAWCFICAISVSKLFHKANKIWKNIIFKACACTFAYLALGTLFNIL